MANSTDRWAPCKCKYRASKPALILIQTQVRLGFFSKAIKHSMALKLWWLFCLYFEQLSHILPILSETFIRETDLKWCYSTVSSFSQHIAFYYPIRDVFAPEKAFQTSRSATFSKSVITITEQLIIQKRLTTHFVIHPLTLWSPWIPPEGSRGWGLRCKNTPELFSGGNL